MDQADAIRLMKGYLRDVKHGEITFEQVVKGVVRGSKLNCIS